MKPITRIDRERAKELLARIELQLSSLSGQRARETVVHFLNDELSPYSWVGIYLIQDSELQLDAWSGPQASKHTTIPVGKGVCGWTVKSGRTEIVSDVRKDPRYLECFASTKSEIVVPILHDSKVIGALDIDSDADNAFSSIDREFLEAVARKISKFCLN
jgi:GAF domain-containing protein